jgi:hypothetical protein
MTEELVYALRRIPRQELAAWGKDSATLFGAVLLRRGKNLGNLLAGFAGKTIRVVLGGNQARKDGNLFVYARERAIEAKDAVLSTSSQIAESAMAIQEAVRSNPREIAPELVVSTLAYLVASGGIDGDGGVPDLDLLAGIGAHRSIFTHSIISGAAIETFLLASASFIGIAYTFLPSEHDPLWDAVAKHRDRFTLAASKGASLGIAYHLFIDSTLDVGAYHDLPFSVPIEGHQAIAGANAAAEAMDVKRKRPVRPKRHG